MADMTPEIPPCGFSLQLSPGTKFLTVTELLDKTASAIHPYRAGEEEEVFSTQCENPPGRIPIDSSKLDQIPIRPFKRAVTRQEHEKRLLEAIEQGRITLLNPITFTPLKPVPSKLSEKRDEVVPLEQFILFARTLRIEVVVEEPSTDPQALAQENERLKARLAKIESTGPGPPLTSRERDNLYRMIGGVVLLIMESKAGRRFGRETKVNRAVLLTELDRVLTTVEARTEGISKGRAPCISRASAYTDTLALASVMGSRSRSRHCLRGLMRLAGAGKMSRQPQVGLVQKSTIQNRLPL